MNGSDLTVTPAHLQRQLRFLSEIDRLKSVVRATGLMDGSRRENSAEHSWHLAMCAMVLAEHAPAAAAVSRALAMALIHDIVEIDAGDVFCYDEAAYAGKLEREWRAAERVFGLLPEDQGRELRELWEEFEAGESADARFAVALDRLQPLLQNHGCGGGTWRRHGITRERVERRMEPIRRGAPALWPFVVRVLDELETAGVFGADPGVALDGVPPAP